MLGFAGMLCFALPVFEILVCITKHISFLILLLILSTVPTEGASGRFTGGCPGFTGQQNPLTPADRQCYVEINQYVMYLQRERVEGLLEDAQGLLVNRIH